MFDLSTLNPSHAVGCFSSSHGRIFFDGTKAPNIVPNRLYLVEGIYLADLHELRNAVRGESSLNDRDVWAVICDNASIRTL